MLIYKENNKKKDICTGAADKNMLQFKQLSQCNCSYCYGFGILETGETARYLCKGILTYSMVHSPS